MLFAIIISGVFKLDSIEPLHNIPAAFPKDIVLFQHPPHTDNWYAVTLESEEPYLPANVMVMYKKVVS